MKNPIEDHLHGKLISYGAVSGGFRYLVAFSGGPDSTALLAAAAQVRDRDARFSFEAVHIDHRLRSDEELTAERALAGKNCELLGITLRIAQAEPGEIEAFARELGCGTEAAAREFRYTRLSGELEKGSWNGCLLAHTFDDQIETLLQRICEGAGSDSAAGIPEIRKPFFRPFLGLEKKELLDYLAGRGLQSSLDSTNKEDVFLRNRIRSRIVPALEEVFPGYRKGVERFLEKQEMARRALDLLLPCIPFEKEGERSVSWEEAAFAEAPEEARRRFLYGVFPVVSGGRGRLPYPLVKRIIDMARDGEILIEALGTRLARREGRFFWDGVVVLRGKNGYIKQIRKGEPVDIPGSGSALVTFQGLKPPVIVRSRSEGDSISLSGGRKKIKKLFQEWGVPESVRDSIPLLEDGRGIAAVFGSPFGFPDRITAGLQKYVTIKMEYPGEPRE